MNSRFYSCLFILINAFNLLANERADSLRGMLLTELSEAERITTTHALFGALVNNNSDSALIHARESIALSASYGDDKLHGQSMMNLTHAFFVNNELDSAKAQLMLSIPFYEKTENFFMVAASYRNLAVIGEATEMPDTSLYYLEKCLEVLSVHPDSSVLGDVYMSQGFAYNTKGYYQLALQSLLTSNKIFEELNKPARLAYAALNLGMTYGYIDKLQEAIYWSEKSVSYFREVNNVRAEAQILNNLGIFARENRIWDKAIMAHLLSIEKAKQTEQPDVEMDAGGNLAKVYLEKGDLDSCLFYLSEIEPLATALESDFMRSAINRMRSEVALLKNRKSEARNWAVKSESFLVDYQNPVESEEMFFGLAEIYKQLNEPDKALYYWEKGSAIQDSIFNLKQSREVEELHLIYETEKKNSEIQLLNAKLELDEAKRRRLIIILALLAIAAAAVVSAIYQRSKRNKMLLEREKEIEIEKRESAERELEFKKKELVSKALQLAKKNEFLSTLEEEVNQLKSTVDININKSSARIARMIHSDTSDDEEWDQFSKEFSSIHQGFIDRLIEQFGSFSKSELRLITLLKMNLSSKDMANTLRISDEGIKKAKYRLRKKMGLASDTETQTFILNY